MREFFKRWPGFYYTVVDLFGPLYFGGTSLYEFIKKYGTDGVWLNLGSGARFLDARFTNVDSTKYDIVSVVADLTELPFDSSSVSLIYCDNVLEHVIDPVKAVKEMHRVLKPGGAALVCVPFLYPFHSSPYDYTRYTHLGLGNLFKDFSNVTVGVRAGPFSTLTAYLVYVSAIIFSFGNARLYELLVNLFIFVYFPLKYLDIFGNHLPFAREIASDFYVIAVK